MFGKYGRVTGLVAMLALMVAASIPVGGQAAAQAENVFVYVMDSTIPELDPSIDFSNEVVVMTNVYEPLVWYNPPGSEELVSPGLATSWDVSDDGMTWTFHLREGVTFHDGTPLTAEAVKQSIERTIEMGQGASFIWWPVEEINAVDDLTVEFKLSYPAPLDLIASSAYGAWIFSPQAAENGTEWFNEGHDGGTGPYMIQSRERGQNLVLTRYEDYWGGWEEGQFDTVVFLIVEDPLVRQQMIEAGEADFTLRLPLENVETLDDNPDVNVVIFQSYQNLLGFFNTRKPPLDDVRVRQALSYAYPYDQLINDVMMGYAVQAHGPVPTGMWGHSDDLPQYTYDLDRARELLAEAGYPDGGFELVWTYNTGNLDEEQAGEIYRASLAELGIELTLQPMTWEAQWDWALSDPENAQDIFVMYWWPTYVTPYDFLFNMFHSEEEPLFNLGYYNNPDFDELIDQADALTGTDRERAEELFIQAQEMLIEDAPALFLYDEMNIHYLRSDITGYVPNPAYANVVFVYQLRR